MTVMVDRACPDLGQATEQELAALWDSAGGYDNPALAAAIEAELDGRDRRQREQPARRQARSDDPAMSDGYELARQQMLHAEAATKGNLVRRDSPVTDGWQLWAGPERWAMAHCTEELRNFWLENPRVVVTAYQQAARHQQEVYRDELDRDAAAAIRDGRPEQAGTGSGGDRPGDAVPGPAARPVPQAALGGGRPAGNRADVRGRTVTGTRLDGQPYSPAMQAAKARNAGTAWPQAPAEVAVVEPAAVMSRERAAVSRIAPEDQIPGADVLDAIRIALGYFAWWPSDEALDAATLFCAQSHARAKNQSGWLVPVWQYAAHWLNTSEAGGSGKTWMTRLMLALCPSGRTLIEPTKASLIQLISQGNTIAITELDRLLGQRGTRNSWAVSIPNAMYAPGNTSPKMQGGVAVEMPLFGSMILDGLWGPFQNSGTQLNTLAGRCQINHVERAPDDEDGNAYRSPRFDRAAQEQFRKIRDLTAMWMSQAVVEGIGDFVPELPAGVGNRAADIWEPSGAVAHWAGGPWPERFAAACKRLDESSGLPPGEAAADVRGSSTLEGWAEAQGMEWSRQI